MFHLFNEIRFRPANINSFNRKQEKEEYNFFANNTYFGTKLHVLRRQGTRTSVQQKLLFSGRVRILGS
jgi:hypothetical protein